MESRADDRWRVARSPTTTPLPLRKRNTYRADFDWDGADEAAGIVGEFDGLEKYGRLRRDGESVADAVIREKVREDELRALGYVVIRWTWAVLERAGLVTLLRPWLTRCGLIAS